MLIVQQYLQNIFLLGKKCTSGRLWSRTLFTVSQCDMPKMSIRTLHQRNRVGNMPQLPGRTFLSGGRGRPTSLPCWYVQRTWFHFVPGLPDRLLQHQNWTVIVQSKNLYAFFSIFLFIYKMLFLMSEYFSL